MVDEPVKTEENKVESKSTETKSEGMFTGVRDTPVGPMDDINYHRMADALDIDYQDRKIPHIQEKIAFLADWAKQQTKSEDRLTQTLAIRELCKRLGLNITGKEMITKLHRWTYLDMQRKRIELQQGLI